MGPGEYSVVLRIDDVGRPDLRLWTFIEGLLRTGASVTCGVVPTWLTTACADYLLQLSTAFPGGIEIHQHGHSHLNRSIICGLKYEHSAWRPFEEQAAELKAGQEALAECFADRYVPVLSPPFGWIDETVALLATHVGFKALTGVAPRNPRTRTLFGRFPFEVPSSIPVWSAQIDLLTWDPPERKTLAQVTAELDAVESQPVVVITLHPQAIASSDIPELTRMVCTMFRGRRLTGFQALLGRWLPGS